MKESFWAILVVMIGIISMAMVFLFQDITNTDEHNYALLKETTESAMIDALDLPKYRETGEIRIDREKFVENFVRRFAENATLAQSYNIKIYDVNETPPKVSIQISSKKLGISVDSSDSIIEFDIVNRLDAILETP